VLYEKVVILFRVNIDLRSSVKCFVFDESAALFGGKKKVC